jgi:hypothetical protein
VLGPRRPPQTVTGFDIPSLPAEAGEHTTSIRGICCRFFRCHPACPPVASAARLRSEGSRRGCCLCRMGFTPPVLRKFQAAPNLSFRTPSRCIESGRCEKSAVAFLECGASTPLCLSLIETHYKMPSSYRASPARYLQPSHLVSQMRRAFTRADIAQAVSAEQTPKGANAPPNQAPLAMIVNESFARKYLANQNPLGKEATRSGRTLQIVGVVRDTKYGDLRTPMGPLAFVPAFNRGVHFEVRTALDPGFWSVLSARSPRASIPPFPCSISERKRRRSIDRRIWSGFRGALLVRADQCWAAPVADPRLALTHQSLKCLCSAL